MTSVVSNRWCRRACAFLRSIAYSGVSTARSPKVRDGDVRGRTEEGSCTSRAGCRRTRPQRYDPARALDHAMHLVRRSPSHRSPQRRLLVAHESRADARSRGVPRFREIARHFPSRSRLDAGVAQRGAIPEQPLVGVIVPLRAADDRDGAMTYRRVVAVSPSTRPRMALDAGSISAFAPCQLETSS